MPAPPASTPVLSALLVHQAGATPTPLGQADGPDGLLVLYTQARGLAKNPELLSLLAPLLLGAGAGGEAEAGRYVQALVDGDRAFEAAPSLHLLHPPHATGATATAVRLVFCSTGSLDGDVDDCRRFADAGKRAFARCVGAGIARPLVLFADPPTASTSTRRQREYGSYLQVTLLAFLHAAYVPLQAREHAAATNKPHPHTTLTHMTLLRSTQAEVDAFPALLQAVQAVDAGKVIAKGRWRGLRPGRSLAGW
jgi:hypothetical protein